MSQMPSKRIRNKQGMTLFEVVIAMLIASVISTVLAAVLTQSIKSWSSGASKEAANSSATIALQKLSYDIRNARSATATSSTLTVVFPLLRTDPYTGEQVYDQSADDPAVYTYYVDSSTNCLMKSVNGTTTVFARNITSAVFGALGGRVTVTLTSKQQLGYSSTAQQDNDCQQITGYISLRNY